MIFEQILGYIIEIFPCFHFENKFLCSVEEAPIK
jgi:hypothetical protein